LSINILCADDSNHVLDILARVLSSAPDIGKVYKARNGEEALQMMRTFSPDVVTLDLKMPVLDGLQTLKKIRTFSETPVIMISTYTQPEALITLEALEEGAFGFIPKPASGKQDDLMKMRDELIKLIESAYEATTIKNSEISEAEDERIKYNSEDLPDSVNCVDTIEFPEEMKQVFSAVCIGSSAGGPKALSKLISKLSESFPYPVFIVQHIPEFFTPYLTENLNSKSSISVRQALHGELAEPGVVYVAPGNCHMRIRKIGSRIKIVLDREFPLVAGAKPSVDVLMESAAVNLQSSAVGVILSGMGQDGAHGLMKMKEAGAVTLVQDRSSALVYGMANTALKLGAVDNVVDIESIPEFILYSAQLRKDQGDILTYHDI